MAAMRAFLAEMFQFMRGRPDHPIYRREQAGWSYVRLWRNLRRGCLPIILAILLLTAGGCGLLTLLSLVQYPSDFDWFYRGLLTVGAASVGIFYAGEIVLQIAGIIATVLTSTSISSEIEADTFGLVRLTLVPIREVVLAKFGAVMRELRTPVIVVVGTRAFLLCVIPALLLSAFVYAAATLGSSPTSSGATSPGSVAPFLLPATLIPLVAQLTTSILGLISLLIAGFLWLAYYFTQPMLDMMLFSAVGIAASTLSRTRAAGLFAGFGLRIGLWLGACMLNQVASAGLQIFLTPALMLPAFNQTLAQTLAANPGILVAAYGFGMGLSILIVMLVQFAVSVILLRFAEGRAKTLPFNV